MRTSIALAGLGLAMLVAAVILYPSTPELSTPGYSQLFITSTGPVLGIGYSVTQVSPSVAKLTVSVSAPAGAPVRTATVTVEPPIGIAFTECPARACRIVSNGSLAGTFWTKPLTLAAVGGAPRATAVFTLKAADFGVVASGVTASAVIPQVLYEGPQTPEPTLLARYRIPAAAAYDWSSYPPAGLTGSAAVWEEALPPGTTPSRVAVGINHAAQSNHDTLALAAGTLLGLAGGALVSALQEFLNDLR